MKKHCLLLICLIMFASGPYLSGCGSSSSGGGGGGTDSGSTLTGTVDSFTASLSPRKDSFYTRLRNILLRDAYAATSGVTVTVGSKSDTTDSTGAFEISNISTGNQTVTFEHDGDTASYSLQSVTAGETYTLNDTTISGTTVSTANTGTWTGTIEMADGDDEVTYTLTLMIAAGGNSLSGTMTVPELGEKGSFTGTEDGSTITAEYEITGTNCTLTGPITGTFDGDTLEGNAPVTTDSCGLEPDDDDPEGHAFTLTKES